jgi:signal transduction histidine kinase
VVAGRLDLSVLSNIMTTYVGLGETGETYLVSLENNYLVTNSRFDGYPLNRAYHSEGIDAALAGQAGAGYYTGYRGADVAGVYRWLPEIQLGMLSEIEQSEARQAGDRQGQISRVVGVIIALIAGAAGIAVSIWITRPIEALTRTATLIAQGDYGQRVSVRQHNEIGQLATAFNQMTDQLESTFTNLEENIQQLEKSQKENVRLIRELRDSLVFKDQFLATMSHELRTPLNAIIGYTGIALIQGGLPEKAAHMLERVKINSIRLLSLINDILDISRINAGGVELVRRPINMHSMVNGWYEDLQRQQEQFGKTNIIFALDFDDRLPEAIIGDEERISQIAINLLTNAFKFTEEGEITLAVRRGTTTWNMSITDSGQGIPETWQHLIFDEFRQVDGTSKRKHGGTGLGLSIVKKLCLLMGGTVTVNSKLNEGSTVTVTLPLEVAVELEPQPA